MRTYQTLNQFKQENNTVFLSNSDPSKEMVLSMAREGDRVAISVCVGALELGLRLHHDELQRGLNSLTPVPGLTTTRQVGNVAASIGIGSMEDGALVLRPSLISDATGHLTINLLVEKAVAEKFLQWINS